MMVFSRFGIKGIVIAGIALLALWKLGGIDPAQLLEGGGVGSSTAPVEITAEEQELFDFVTVVLACWNRGGLGFGICPVREAL